MDRKTERSIRRRAYFIWEEAGRPEGCALEHWVQAAQSIYREHDDTGYLLELEKLLEGRPDADFPAILTNDVKGG